MEHRGLRGWDGSEVSDGGMVPEIWLKLRSSIWRLVSVSKLRSGHRNDKTLLLAPSLVLRRFLFWIWRPRCWEAVLEQGSKA
jgi:hypothetical protein